jgi:hypothetical protein
MSKVRFCSAICGDNRATAPGRCLIPVDGDADDLACPQTRRLSPGTDRRSRRDAHQRDHRAPAARYSPAEARQPDRAVDRRHDRGVGELLSHRHFERR